MPPRQRRRRQLCRRARRGKRSRMVVNRSLQPISQRYICKMKYAEIVTTPVTGLYAFNLNSLFDPNRTGVGHQPYSFDVMATMYNRYRVISCGYRIHVAGGNFASQAVQVASLPANEELSTVSISEWRENPRSKYICQNPGAFTTILKGKVYIPSLVGRTKSQYMADDRYQALVTGNPQELAILNLVTAQNADTPVGSIQLQVLLEYTVEFFDVKHLPRS